MDKLKGILIIGFLPVAAVISVYSTLVQTEPALYLNDLFTPNPVDKPERNTSPWFQGMRILAWKLAIVHVNDRNLHGGLILKR